MQTLDLCDIYIHCTAMCRLLQCGFVYEHVRRLRTWPGVNATSTRRVSCKLTRWRSYSPPSSQAAPEHNNRYLSSNPLSFSLRSLFFARFSRLLRLHPLESINLEHCCFAFFTHRVLFFYLQQLHQENPSLNRSRSRYSIGQDVYLGMMMSIRIRESVFLMP